jgi:hypothetical protein
METAEHVRNRLVQVLSEVGLVPGFESLQEWSRTPANSVVDFVSSFLRIIKEGGSVSK